MIETISSLLLVYCLSSPGGPGERTLKPESKIEAIVHEGGGAISTRYKFVGKVQRRLVHTIEIHAAWVTSSRTGEARGIRIQVVSPEPKHAGEIWIDPDEVKDLEAALVAALATEDEAFFVGRGAGRIGRVKLVDAIEPILQRDSRSDAWLTMDKESLGKLLDFIKTAKDLLAK